MNALDAAEYVLSKTGSPMTASDITKRILTQSLWQTQGKTPLDTVEARLAVDIRDKGTASRFQRCAPRLFALRKWGLAEYVGKAFKKKAKAANEIEPGVQLRNEAVEEPSEISVSEDSESLSFSDAAERVLEQFGNNKPMHYREITRRALELGLVSTRGQTPEQTMYAQLLTDIERQRKRGRTGRFSKHGNGFIGLNKWVDASLDHQIEQHNRKARSQLRELLHVMPSSDFEKLIGLLLIKLGFEDVIVTSPNRDSGIQTGMAA